MHRCILTHLVENTEVVDLDFLHSTKDGRDRLPFET